MTSLPANLPNPFAGNIIENTWNPPPADVPALHKKAFDKFMEVAAGVRQEGKSTSVVIQGPAGSGKTHLFARLRQEAPKRDPDCMLAWIRLSCTADHLWRCVRESLVAELLLDSADGKSHLQRLLQNQFPAWAPPRPDLSVFGGIIFGGNGGTSLAACLTRVAQPAYVHPGLVKVLPIILDPNQEADVQQLARSWLRGDKEGLSDDDYRRLDLAVPDADKTARDEEVEAKKVVLSLCRLAGKKTRLGICFDQVEGLQHRTRDVQSLVEFAVAATDLVADPHSALLVATFCRHEIRLDLQKADLALWQRLGVHQASIPVLSYPQMSEVYESRRDSLPAVAALAEASADRYWPLGEAFLRATWDKWPRQMTPRHLLIACEAEFRRRQGDAPPPDEEDSGDHDSSSRTPAPDPVPHVSGSLAPEGAATATLAPPAQVVSPEWRLNDVWEQRRRDAKHNVAAINVDLALTQGVAVVLEASGCPLRETRPIPITYGDVDTVFVWDGGKRKYPPLGVSICTHDRRYRLTPRLKRVKKQWDVAQKARYLGELVVVRPASATEADVGGQLLTEFDLQTRTPTRVVRPDDQQLAELAAIQRLFQQAHNGELTFPTGAPIYAEHVREWLAGNTPSSVWALIHDIFGDRTQLLGSD